MSKDQMQDVFPSVFDFQKGEQPTAQKLTAFVKSTNSAFSRITQAVGDPWDYQSRAYLLSPEKLGQASLARLLGPSDHMSPGGRDWNQTTSSVTVTLASYRNTWVLGYPLVVTSGTISETSTHSDVAALDWNTKVSIAGDTGSVLTTKVSSIERVNGDGDFYVDLFKGIIYAYKVPTTAITLTISDINLFGPGVPWGTHNVIPTWEESTNLCTVVQGADAGGYSFYTLTLPAATVDPRTGNTFIPAHGERTLTNTHTADSTWAPLSAAPLYRLPQSLISAGLSPTDVIPEGYLMLYEEGVTPRIMNQIEFQWASATTITLKTPINWLTVATGYRIITSGTSLAESVSYLMQVMRNNEHIGLANSPTLSYNMPLSHDNLENRYSGEISSYFATTVDRWKFTESYSPVNPHPQYLHRGGYMEEDIVGNSANAMRGNLVFTATLANDFDVETGYETETYGIMFGAGLDTGSVTQASKLYWKGGEGSTWTTGSANTLGFGLDGLSFTTGGSSEDKHGAVSLRSYYGAPLYLEGTNYGDTEKQGGAIGFDFGRNNELNFVKVIDGVNRNADDPLQPAQTAGMTSATALTITNGLDNLSTHARISPYQLREFRFRGGAYVSGAFNYGKSLGASSGYGDVSTTDTFSSAIYSFSATNTIVIAGEWVESLIVGRNIIVAGGDLVNAGTYEILSFNISSGRTNIVLTTSTLTASASVTGKTVAIGLGEFDRYFSSPSILGADWLNVYSNAIFFSDTGDGTTTSFTDKGEAWLNGNDSNTSLIPSGLYYVPDNISSQDPYFMFSSYDSGLGSTQPLEVGTDHGFFYRGAKSWTVVGNTLLDRSVFELAETTLNTIALFGTASANQDLRVVTWGAGSEIQIASFLSSISLTTWGTDTATGAISLATADGGINILANSWNSPGVAARDINITTSRNSAVSSPAGDINITSGNDMTLIANGDLGFLYLGGKDSNTEYVQVEANTHCQMYVESAGRVLIDNDSDCVKITNYKVGGQIWLENQYGNINLEVSERITLDCVNSTSGLAQLHMSSDGVVSIHSRNELFYIYDLPVGTAGGSAPSGLANMVWRTHPSDPSGGNIIKIK